MLRVALVANVGQAPFGNNLLPPARAFAALSQAKLFAPADDPAFTPTGGAAPASVPLGVLGRIAECAPEVVVCLGGGLVIPQDLRAHLPGEPVLVGLALSDPQALSASLQIAPHFDLYYTQDRGSLARYHDLGVAAGYLPLAADPEVFTPTDGEKNTDLLYVGKWTPYRDQLVQAAARVAVVRVVAYRGETRWSVEVGGQLDDEASLAAEVNRARVVLDPTRVELHPEASRDPHRITPRALMAAACAVPALVEDSCPLDGLFTPGAEIATFDGSPEGLVRSLGELLVNHGRRQRMGEAARRRLVAQHTWRHRAHHVLGEVVKLRPTLARRWRGEGGWAQPGDVVIPSGSVKP